MRKTLLTVKLIIAVCLVNGCSESRSEVGLIADKISATDTAFVFLTTDWCGGGALTYQNLVQPKFAEFEQKGVACFAILFGEMDQFKLTSSQFEGSSQIDAEKFSVVEGFLVDVPPFHRMEMNAMCKALDPDWETTDSVPITAIYMNGKLTKIQNLWIDW